MATSAWFRIPHESQDLPACWDTPEHGPQRFGVLLAHGAGAPLDHPFLQYFASGLAQGGGRVLRFDYPYMAERRATGKRRPPDRAQKLLEAHRSAWSHFATSCDGLPLFLAGKSMGARISSLLVASAQPAQIRSARGLLMLGYPLHPPNRAEQLRTEHFPDVCVPSLFLQGTRDELCRAELLDGALAKLGASHRRVWIEDGAHSFEVRKRSGRTTEAAMAEALGAALAWVEELV